LKDLIRAGASDQVIEKQLLSAVLNKPLDGWEAEKNKTNNIIGQPSMATIGG
jgi:cyclic pyranopterin phosphate synthase